MQEKVMVLEKLAHQGGRAGEHAAVRRHLDAAAEVVTAADLLRNDLMRGELGVPSPTPADLVAPREAGEPADLG